MKTVLNLKQLDIVYISYDEPLADRNYDEIAASYPRAKRVHGVKGLDAAHKAAARLAEGDHFITIDGDNVSVDRDLFDQVIQVDRAYLQYVINFSARNKVNGLVYGNGGIKVWPRQLVLDMQTHENSNNRRNATEFCWDLAWYKSGRVASEVDITGTPFQAFRAGFREGIKFLTTDGISPREAFPDQPLKDAFHRHVWTGTAARLSIWCSVGADVEHGLFAMYGARLGASMFLFDNWDRSSINDYAAFKSWWQNVITPRLAVGVNHHGRLWEEIHREGDRLRRGIGLQVADLDAEGSSFYKKVHAPPDNTSGPLRPQLNVKQKQREAHPVSGELVL